MLYSTITTADSSIRQ